MPIYRGPGGAGDATQDASSEVLLALLAKDAAIAAQLAAEAAQAGAELAETNAETAETNAETAETNAETAATNAANSATAAAASAASIIGDVALAQAARIGAETAETNAETAQAAAASSASAASTSASNASTSATNASTSASTATTAATNAGNSATAAANSASSASTSATNASNSASSASTSAASAASSATSAASSASTATTKAGEALTSANNAASSASNASTSASNASTSASNAATSASNASNSATAAANAQTAAEAARDATLTAYDNFDDRYLGAKSSDPVLDNDGNALVAGSLYFNTSIGGMKVYTGSAWVVAYVSGGSYLAAANNLSDLTDFAVARSNLGLGSAATTSSTDYATTARGLPVGGTTGQTLVKSSNSDYATAWATVDALPSQSGNAGKYLTTNGTTASWAVVNVTPALDDLTDVTITSPAANQYLRYNGTAWVNSGIATNTRTEVSYTATAGQTTFSATYTPGLIDVYLNGSRLDPADYTASNGTTVVLDSGATVNDIVNIIAYGTFNIASVPVSSISATGTPSSTTYLRGDGSWSTINVTPALDDLSDVAITSPTNGHVLQYNGTAWVNTASSGGGAQAGVFYENDTVIATSYTITANKNAMSAGELTLSSGSVTVTVNDGSTWTVI